MPPISSTASLLVNINDIDDMGPKFSQSLYSIQVREDPPSRGTTGPRRLDFSPALAAEDQDAVTKSPLRYRISAGNDLQYFNIDRDTGHIFLVKEVDREALDNDKFVLEVTAWQTDNELKSARAAVEIGVLDINDNKPEFEVERYNMTVIENLPAGFRIMQFTAQDHDLPENAAFSYKLDDPSGAFDLEQDGSLVLGRPDLFDREKSDRIVVRVLAVEHAPSVLPDKTPAGVDVEIHLLDYNDNSPAFLPDNVYVFKVPASAKVGHTLGQVKATDLDLGPNAEIVYSIKNRTLPLPVSLDPVTGEILLTKLYNKQSK